ncbi:sigma-54 dependent transcriptional regulator [Iodidimonas sp. SYSU 1G8]|uniref:sigma-54-dependent transcriptional regulator n=1 Tax=Iodidimonas sp. SYSU 1G8 TaxID=3133967 RepID=UPI0031FF240B
MFRSFDIPVRMLLVGTGSGEFRSAAEMARDQGAQVVTAGSVPDAMADLRASGADLVMIDVTLDVGAFLRQMALERMNVPVLACGIEAPAALAVGAIRAGARDYVPLPPHPELIAAAILSVTNHAVQMIGDDPAYLRAVDFGLAMSRADLPVLVVGESGSGKEMMARAIHAASGRPGRFVAVNCATAATEMLEAELFGQESGAFEGAVARRRGRIEEAASGTLYLRDIAALESCVQSRLQRMMDTRAMCRLGGSEDIPVTARIIAGSCHDLTSLAEAGALRPELQSRLGLVTIGVPPLRERPADMDAMAAYFARRFAVLNGLTPPQIDPAAIAVLSAYGWPGNVRELEHVMLRAVLLTRGAAIDADALRLADGTRLADLPSRSAVAPAPVVEGLVGHTVADVERELILHTLEHCRGNRTYASSILGISVRTMRNKIRSFIEAGIPVAPTL